MRRTGQDERLGGRAGGRRLARASAALRGIAAVVAIGAVGCLPEGAPPWLVDHAIVASVRFDVAVRGPFAPESPRDDRQVASLMPGDRLRATPFLVGPAGPIDAGAVQPAWFYCRATRCFGDVTQGNRPRACAVEDVGSTTTCALGRAAAPELELGALLSLIDLFGDPPSLMMVAGAGETDTASCVDRLRRLQDDGETLQACTLTIEPLPLGPLWRLMLVAAATGLPDALPLTGISPEVQAAQPALYPAVLPFELTITGVDGQPREVIAADGASVAVARGEHVQIVAPVDVFDIQLFYQALLGNGSEVLFQATFESFSSSWLFTADVAPDDTMFLQQVDFVVPEDAPATIHGYYLLGDGRSQVWAWLRFEVAE